LFFLRFSVFLERAKSNGRARKIEWQQFSSFDHF